MVIKQKEETKRFSKKTNAEIDKTTNLTKGNRAQRNRGTRGGEAASY